MNGWKIIWKVFTSGVKIKYKYYLLWINKNIFRVKYASPEEFQKQCKSMTKNELIADIVVTASKINKADTVIPCGFKKELRGHSKKNLIRTLVYLKLSNQLR
jgi:hypothetical protein